MWQLFQTIGIGRDLIPLFMCIVMYGSYQTIFTYRDNTTLTFYKKRGETNLYIVIEHLHLLIIIIIIITWLL